MKLKALALVIVMSGAGQAFANTGAVDVYGNIVASLPPASLSSYASGNVNYSYYMGSGNKWGSFAGGEDSNTGALVSAVMASHGYGYDAQAYAEYGATHAKASTTYDSSNPYYSNSNASAGANYTDWFVITGGTGMAWASLTTELDGTLAGGGGNANASFEVSYSPMYNCWSCGDLSQSYQTVIGESQSISGRQTRTSESISTGEFAFTYDQPFQLSTSLWVSASNCGWADYFNTGNITGFILPAGASLSSGSGQFVTGVPEPETYAMMLAGLGLMGTV
ncbi:MAG: PEP-CTERM sorting domain-containing protein, partial [Gallionellaceae bacterium]|nr:PEP-CTERM sorting domain-containing protein [Gallionellaceae bacterium]